MSIGATGPRIKPLTPALSPREREICIALGRGVRPVDIAIRLGISPGTVSSVQSTAREKLGLTSSRQLGEYARNQGWC